MGTPTLLGEDVTPGDRQSVRQRARPALSRACRGAFHALTSLSKVRVLAFLSYSVPRVCIRFLSYMQKLRLREEARPGGCEQCVAQATSGQATCLRAQALPGDHAAALPPQSVRSAPSTSGVGEGCSQTPGSSVSRLILSETEI